MRDKTKKTVTEIKVVRKHTTSSIKQIIERLAPAELLDTLGVWVGAVSITTTPAARGRQCGRYGGCGWSRCSRGGRSRGARGKGRN